jgi:hypothetical protein
MTGRRVKIDFRKAPREELPGRLAQDAGAVAGSAVGSSSSPVRHRRNGGQRQTHDFMLRRTTQVRQKSDPARVVFFC